MASTAAHSRLHDIEDDDSILDNDLIDDDDGMLNKPSFSQLGD